MKLKSKTSNSYLPFKCKRSQSEVITTVLMVLIGIVAVGLLSTFVINLVRDNLKSSDCLQLQGKITLDTGSGFTFFNLTDKYSYVVVKNDWAGSNLTGLNIILDDGMKSKTYKIRVTDSDAKVKMFDGSNPLLPQSSNPKETYKINSSSDFKTSVVKTVSVIPVLAGETACNDAFFETNMPSYP